MLTETKGKRKEIGKGKREDNEKNTHKIGVKEKRWPRSKQQWEKAARGSYAAPELSGRSSSTACALPHFAVSSSFLQTLKLHLTLMRCSDITSWKGNRSAH